MCASAASTSGMTSFPSTKMGRRARLRSATCSTARPSVRLMGAPANMRSRMASTPAARERAQQRHRLVGDAVLRVVEQQIAEAQREAREAVGVLREELAHEERLRGALVLL